VDGHGLDGGAVGPVEVPDRLQETNGGIAAGTRAKNAASPGASDPAMRSRLPRSPPPVNRVSTTIPLRSAYFPITSS